MSCATSTRELMKRLGVSPVFSTPYHAESVVERSIQTLENTIAKMARPSCCLWPLYLEKLFYYCDYIYVLKGQIHC